MKTGSATPSAGTALLAVVALALTACGAAAQGTGSGSHSASGTASARPPASGEPACGAAAPGILAVAAGTVARRIYAGELAGTETRSDQRQVETDAALLRAVASGERSVVASAVTTLVYSHTHIVRLRVTRGSTVLADVGGPYILAPVGGSLRLGRRTIGHYVLSVQDDLGYVKLVSRFIGAPLVMRAGSREIPVEGQLASPPASIPNRGPVRIAGAAYDAFSFDAQAYPSGPLRISLLLALPPRLSFESCAAIKSGELGRAAQRISRRFSLSPANFSTYVKLAASLTGGLVYIRSGSHQLAGSTPAAPSRMPTVGAFKRGGKTYFAYSFQTQTSVGRVRVFQLTPP